MVAECCAFLLPTDFINGVCWKVNYIKSNNQFKHNNNPLITNSVIIFPVGNQWLPDECYIPFQVNFSTKYTTQYHLVKIGTGFCSWLLKSAIPGCRCIIIYQLAPAVKYHTAFDTVSKIGKNMKCTVDTSAVRCKSIRYKNISITA